MIENLNSFEKVFSGALIIVGLTLNGRYITTKIFDKTAFFDLQEL